MRIENNRQTDTIWDRGDGKACERCGGIPPCAHGYRIMHGEGKRCGTEFPCPDCIDGRQLKATP